MKRSDSERRLFSLGCNKSTIVIRKLVAVAFANKFSPGCGCERTRLLIEDWSVMLAPHARARVSLFTLRSSDVSKLHHKSKHSARKSLLDIIGVTRMIGNLMSNTCTHSVCELPNFSFPFYLIYRCDFPYPFFFTS